MSGDLLLGLFDLKDFYVPEECLKKEFWTEILQQNW